MFCALELFPAACLQSAEVKSPGGSPASNIRAVTALFTTGELALLGKAKLPDRLVVIIQASLSE